jgi:putative transposase
LGAPARLCHRNSQSRTPVANEYLATENRILRGQIKGRLLLSDGEKVTLAEIAHRLGRMALEEVAATARPDTILGWYRKLIANKFDGSRGLIEEKT